MGMLMEPVERIESWAEASAGIDVDEKDLRTETEEIEEDGKRYKVTTTYKVITKQVPRVVAERKKWKKFGESEHDGLGPNISTTFACEEISLQFIQGQLEQEFEAERKKEPTRGEASAGRCRLCKQDGHWSHSCPNKELNAAKESKEKAVKENKENEVPNSEATPNKYVPPPGRGERSSAVGGEQRTEEYTCRVTNLPEDMPDLEDELYDLFEQFGRIKNWYLAKDRNTFRVLGYAFVSYERREHAERAIEALDNSKFNHVILSVEQKKPRPE